MKAIELIRILAELPEDMEVVIEVTPQGAALPVCQEKSGIVSYPILDNSDDGYHFQEVACLIPCTCHESIPYQADSTLPLN